MLLRHGAILANRTSDTHWTVGQLSRKVYPEKGRLSGLANL